MIVLRFKVRCRPDRIDEALSALRLTFGDACRGFDARAVIETIVRIATRRRSIAPRRTYEYAYASNRRTA